MDQLGTKTRKPNLLQTYLRIVKTGAPEEIEKFADGAREEMGINGDEDPFEDMDPSEIDAYMQAFAAKEDEDENPS